MLQMGQRRFRPLDRPIEVQRWARHVHDLDHFRALFLQHSMAVCHAWRTSGSSGSMNDALRQADVQSLQRRRIASLRAIAQRRGSAAGRAGDAVGIARIVAGNGIENDSAVFGAACQRPNMVKRPTERDTPKQLTRP